jgi:hypothetical protein
MLLKQEFLGNIQPSLNSILKIPDITPEMIEQATERTKVNTYMKFYNAVVERLSMFIHVFENNGIPYPIIKPPKKTIKRM